MRKEKYFTYSIDKRNKEEMQRAVTEFLEKGYRENVKIHKLFDTYAEQERALEVYYTMNWDGLNEGFRYIEESHGVEIEFVGRNGGHAVLTSLYVEEYEVEEMDFEDLKETTRQIESFYKALNDMRQAFIEEVEYEHQWRAENKEDDAS